MAGIDFYKLRWRKSSHSTHQLNCVEVALADSAVATRDSKNPHGPALIFTTNQWHDFLRHLA